MLACKSIHVVRLIRQFLQFFNHKRYGAVLTQCVVLIVDVLHNFAFLNRTESQMDVELLSLIKAIPEQCNHRQTKGIPFASSQTSLFLIKLVSMYRRCCSRNRTASTFDTAVAHGTSLPDSTVVIPDGRIHVRHSGLTSVVAGITG